MLYECYIKNDFRRMEIEADSELEAKREFVEIVVDNLDISNVDADALDAE